MAADDARCRHDVHPANDDYSFTDPDDTVPLPPDFTLYATNEARIATFKGNWDTKRKPDPRTMSQAGFLYLGPGDKVICFSCKLELKRWTRQSDPLAEHRVYKEELEEECEYLNSLRQGQ